MPTCRSAVIAAFSIALTVSLSSLAIAQDVNGDRQRSYCAGVLDLNAQSSHAYGGMNEPQQPPAAMHAGKSAAPAANN